MKSNQCNKVQYSKKEAETVLNTLKKGKTIFLLGKRRRKIGHKPTKIYHCPDCNHWHLSSKISDMAYLTSSKTNRYNNYPVIEDQATLEEFKQNYELIFYTISNCPRCDVLFYSLVAKGYNNIVRIKHTKESIVPTHPIMSTYPLIYYKGVELRGRRSEDIIKEIKGIERKKVDNEVKED